MKIFVVAILALLTFWLVQPGKKTRTAIVVKGNKQITYIELANKRHNFHTARNMIALGLVCAPTTAADRHLSMIYDGVDTSESPTTARVADLYDLNPTRQGFVGY